MSGGAYFDPYSEGQSIDLHKEQIAVVCNPNAKCFGTPIPDFLDSVRSGIDTYGETVEADENDCLDLFLKSVPGPNQQNEELIDAQKQLLTHSLWLVECERFTEDKSSTPLFYQIQNLPDESTVITWVEPGPKQKETVDSIKSRFPSVLVSSTEHELETHVSGYLQFAANPARGEHSIIQWSIKVAKKIDELG